MKFLYFLISKAFFKHTGIILLLVAVIITATLIMLNVVTQHNDYQKVPDLKAMTLKQVDSLFAIHDFKYEIMDSVFSYTEKPGTVTEQIPEAGTEVKNGRRIYLKMNAILPEKVRMPNLLGISLREAIAKIENSGLIIDTLVYKPDLATNNVLEQRFEGEIIETGKIISKGSGLEIVLGRNSSEKTYVPELCGFKLDSARKIATGKFLNLGAIVYDADYVLDENDSANAIIYKQKPEATFQKILRLGQAVDVWLSVDTAKISDYIIIKSDTLAIDSLQNSIENEE